MNTLNIVYVMLQFFAMFYIQKYMSTFFQEVKTRKSVYILSHFIYPILVSTLYFLWNIPLINLLGNIVALFIITCNYKANILKKIACAVFLYVFMLLVEVGVAVSTGYLGISSLTHGTYAKPSGMIVVSIILFVVSLIFQNVKTIKKNEIVKIEEWIAIITVPIASIYILIHTLDYDDIEQSVAISSVAATLIINVIVFHLYTVLSKTYQEKLDSAMYEQEMTYYFNQCTYMAKNEEKTLRLKHDMKNHLLALSEYFKACNSEQGEKYISNLIGEELEGQKNWSNTGNIIVDSILNFKLNEAENKGVNVYADISVPNNLEMDAPDITVIIGNLLDNTLQAVEKLPIPLRKILVLLKYDKGRLFIKVENSFDGNIKKKDGRFETMKTGADHGYGMKNVERVLEKYEGCVQYEHNEYMFYAKCMIYVKENVLV